MITTTKTKKPSTGYDALRRSSTVAATVGGLFFLSALLAFGGAIHRLSQERTKLRTALSAARFEAERQQKASRVQGALRAEKDAIAELKSLFLGSSNIVPFVETIESLGKALPVGLSLGSVTLSPGKDALSARLTARGSFAELYRMLAIIEALPYKTVIGDTQLSYNGGGDSGGLQRVAGNKGDLPQWSLSVAVTIKSILPDKF